jgi:hypothetical protein
LGAADPHRCRVRDGWRRQADRPADDGGDLREGRPRSEVFVNRAGGGPDGLIIDECDNLWIACNQSNEILVLEPQQGCVIAKLGDFGGIDRNGAPIRFLWSNSLAFHGDDVLVTNLSLDIGALRPTLRTVDGSWAAQVKLHRFKNQETPAHHPQITVRTLNAANSY